MPKLSPEDARIAAIKAGEYTAQGLVLKRTVDQEIIIGDDIILKIIEIRGGAVRILIDCPRDTSVHRREIYDLVVKEAQIERANQTLRTQSQQHSRRLDPLDLPAESSGES